MSKKILEMSEKILESGQNPGNKMSERILDGFQEMSENILGNV